MKEKIENFAWSVSEEGVYVWENYNIEGIEESDDEELIKLYNEAKDATSKYNTAHANFIKHVTKSDKYDFEY